MSKLKNKLIHNEWCINFFTQIKRCSPFYDHENERVKSTSKDIMEIWIFRDEILLWLFRVRIEVAELLLPMLSIGYINYVVIISWNHKSWTMLYTYRNLNNTMWLWWTQITTHFLVWSLTQYHLTLELLIPPFGFGVCPRTSIISLVSPRQF